LMSSETEDRRSDDRLTRGEAQDWLAGLEEVDEQALAEVVPVSDQPDEDDQETVDQHDQESGEAAAEAEMIPDADDWFSDMESAADDDLLEMLAVSGEGEEGVSEHDEQADEEIERAEIPDWMQSAAPIDAGDESGEEAPVVELPEQPVMDEALMTLFEETQEDDSSAVDVLAQAEEPEIEALEPEPEAEQEVGWLEPETSEEDWLGSFTAAEAETEAIDESSAPVASEEDDWLASVPEPEIEAVSDLDEALSFDAVEQSIFESEELEPISEAVDSDEEIPAEAADLAAVAEDAVAVEASDTAEASDTVEVSDMVKDEVGGEEETAADDGPPAWLADMEPITAPEEDQEAIASLLDQPYDPFEGGSPDQVPQYASATDTGILQPDESPDWMSAFTGEELPEEEEPFLDEAEAVESGTEEQDVMSQDLEPDAEQPLEDVSESETDQEWEDEFPAPTDVLADYVYGEDELESMEEDDREMPDWLVAITSSESEQIEGLLPDEPETYSSAEDTGVLQPGNELDWLKDVSESAEESEETQAEEEAVDEARLWSDLDAAEVGEAGAESEDEDDFDFAMLETMAYEADKPEVAESESMEDETLASVVEGEGLPEIETDDELLQDLFAASGEQAALHEDEEAEEIEVAQPDDLEHTKVAVSEAEPVEVAEGESGKEPVPDDFTFYDLLPLWLRQPLERDPDAPMSADYEGASGRPEWLRDVSEDDEDTD